MAISLNPTVAGSNSLLGVVPASARNNSVVALGNSLTGQEVRTPTGGYYTQLGNALFYQINARLNQTFKLLNVAGYSGNTSTQILSYFDSQVTPYSPGYVFLLGWAENDIAQLVSTTTILSNTSALINKCRSIGAKLIITMPTPGGVQLDSSSKAQAWIDTTSALKSYLADFKDVLLLRTDLPYLDATSTYPSPVSGGYTDTAWHWYQRGAHLLADTFATQISSFIGGATDALSSSWFSAISGTGALVGNPLNTGSTTAGGGLSGNVPTSGVTYSLAGTGTGVASLVARSDSLSLSGSQWCRVTYTGPASAVWTTDYIQGATTSTSISTGGLAVGDVIQGLWEVKTNGAVTGLMGAELFIIFTNSSGTYGRAYGNYQNNGSSSVASLLTTGLGQQIMATPPLAIPTGTTAVNMILRVHPVGTSASFAVDFGRHGFRKLDSTWY